MTASQTNAINPFYIVLLAIQFSLLWTKLGAMNKNPNTPIKFALGIFQLGLGFLIFSHCTFIGDNGKVHFICFPWMLSNYNWRLFLSLLVYQLLNYL